MSGHRLPLLAVVAVIAWTAILTAQSPSHAAQSVSGVWAGTAIFKADGETHEEPFHAVLKHSGPALTGTAGPDADRQYRVNNGKVTVTADATVVSFDVIVNGVHTSFELKLVSAALKGTAVIEGEDGRRHAATVDLKPVK